MKNDTFVQELAPEPVTGEDVAWLVKAEQQSSLKNLVETLMHYCVDGKDMGDRVATRLKTNDRSHLQYDLEVVKTDVEHDGDNYIGGIHRVEVVPGKKGNGDMVQKTHYLVYGFENGTYSIGRQACRFTTSGVAYIDGPMRGHRHDRVSAGEPGGLELEPVELADIEKLRATLSDLGNLPQ